MSCRPDTPRAVRTIRVIEVQAMRGAGDSISDPVRNVTQYWSYGGQLLAESDPEGKPSFRDLSAPGRAITEAPQCGHASRRPDGGYLFWFSEICVVDIRTKSKADPQGVPASVLRSIADDMDARGVT